jgi:hypothetical protein
MAGYLYEQMTDDRFQELCQALLTVSFPGVRCFPVGQADGGVTRRWPGKGLSSRSNGSGIPSGCATRCGG